MKIEKIKYVIATKSFPLLFENDECEDIDDIAEAGFLNSLNEAEDELTRFDEPESRIILPVKITYEI